MLTNKIVCYFINVMNVTNIIKCFIQNKMPDGSHLKILDMMMIFATVMVYCVMVSIATTISNKRNSEKIQEVNNSNIQLQQIMKEMKNTADTVKEKVEVGHSIINDLNNSAKNTLDIFDKVVLSNKLNNENIVQQEKLIKKYREPRCDF